MREPDPLSLWIIDSSFHSPPKLLNKYILMSTFVIVKFVSAEKGSKCASLFFVWYRIFWLWPVQKLEEHYFAKSCWHVCQLVFEVNFMLLPGVLALCTELCLVLRVLFGGYCQAGVSVCSLIFRLFLCVRLVLLIWLRLFWRSRESFFLCVCHIKVQKGDILHLHGNEIWLEPASTLSLRNNCCKRCCVGIR